jgi:hypothetical protein
MKYYHYNMKKVILYHLWVRISIYENTIAITGNNLYILHLANLGLALGEV